jgi:hypothetical protein
MPDSWNGLAIGKLHLRGHSRKKANSPNSKQILIIVSVICGYKGAPLRHRVEPVTPSLHASCSAAVFQNLPLWLNPRACKEINWPKALLYFVIVYAELEDQEKVYPGPAREPRGEKAFLPSLQKQRGGI